MRINIIKQLFCFASLVLLITLNTAICAASQAHYKSELTTTRLVADVDVIKPGESFWVMMEVMPKAGWHTYWKNPGDSGMPMSFEWQKPEGVTIDDIKWLPPSKIPVAHLINYGYKGKTQFLVKVSLDQSFSDQFLELKLSASWLVCEEECIPDQAKYNLKIKVDNHTKTSPNYELIHKTVQEYNSVKSIDLKAHKEDGYLYFKLPEAGGMYYLFHEDEGLVTPSAPQEEIIQNGYKYLKVKQDFAELKDGSQGYLKHTNNGAEEYFKVKISLKTHFEISLLLTIIALAFLGGLILNAMPCVLPVLFLKIFSVVKQSKESLKQVRVNGLAYTAGVILSFLMLAAILIFLKLSGQEVGWGFQLQSPIFVFSLAILFVLLGFNFLGFYEFPSLSFNQPALQQNNYLNEFLTGALVVIVASPCTAPFMATSIGFALSQNALVILLIFFFLGLGLAFPFLLISFFPKFSRVIPKPGPWMISLKKMLAFPLFATTVWLVWVLSKQLYYSDFILSVALIVVIAASFLIVRLTQNSLVKLISHTIAIALTAYIGFRIVSVENQPTENNSADVRAIAANIGKKAMFINITASWCITCKVNESLVLSKKSLKEQFNAKKVDYITLDWTNRNDDITEFMSKYNRKGVPVYIFISKDGKEHVLPQLLTESIIMRYLELANLNNGG